MKRIAKIILIWVVIAACATLAVLKVIKTRSSSHVLDDDDAAAPAAPVVTVVSVQTNALKLATLHNFVKGYGTVLPAPATGDQPAASAQLAPVSAGVVASIPVVEGQHVEKGDVILELNSGTMTAAFAGQELQRQKQLYDHQNTSLHNLQNAQAQLDLLRVTAPLSGTVTRINTKLGSAVDVTTVVAEIVDLSRLIVKADIPSSDSGDVKIGEELQALTQTPVSAMLAYVSPVVDSNSGTISVWAPLPADSGLKPGEFVPLQIITAVHTNCLAAPAESVITDENGQSTIALVHGDQADQVPVKAGFREDGWVEIEGAGLKAGDAIVTVGAYGLPDKTKIQVENAAAEETPSTNSNSSADK
jgi:multidrug efflux pump subunit AcrA (membrane-fusion protein)